MSSSLDIHIYFSTKYVKKKKTHYGVHSKCAEGFMLPKYFLCKKNICLKFVFHIFVMCQIIAEHPPLKAGALTKTLLSGDK